MGCQVCRTGTIAEMARPTGRGRSCPSNSCQSRREGQVCLSITDSSPSTQALRHTPEISGLLDVTLILTQRSATTLDPQPTVVNGLAEPIDKETRFANSGAYRYGTEDIRKVTLL